MNVGSCDINELVQVGYANVNPTDAAIYSSFMAAAEAGQAGTGSLIGSMYGIMGIDPVGRPGVYACPRDFEAIIVDRRTGWALETRLGIIAAVLIIVFVALTVYKK